MSVQVTTVWAALIAAALIAGCGGDGGDERRASAGDADGNGALIGDSVFLEPDPAQGEAPKDAPNFVYIVTDDQTFDQLKYMPLTRKLVGRQGATFSAAYASFPLCCPSRTTFLTGQYAHNHGAKGNSPFEDGGGYVNLDQPDRVLPAWLQGAGYQTVHLGKWANAPGPDVPAGWSLWGDTNNKTTNFYDYTLQTSPEEQTRFGFDESDYHSDVLSSLAADYIRERRDPDHPFFLSVAYLAPHDGAGRNDAAGRACGGTEDGEQAKGVAQPALRHAGSLADESLPTPESFNEADVSDKPDFIANEPLLTEEQIAKLEVEYECQVESLLAVDEGVQEISQALADANLTDNTVVIFTSDQGRFNGEHRQGGGKNLPYEEIIQVPLLIRGPGISKGVTDPSLASNVDFAPTILDLAGVEPPPSIDRPRDGASLLPRLGRGEAAGAPDRAGATERLLLIEGREKTEDDGAGGLQVRSYIGIRSSRYLYIEHRAKPVVNARAGSRIPIGAGEVFATELYDMENDRLQLNNLASDPALASIRETLAGATSALQDCEGRACIVSRTVGATAG